MTVVSPRMLAIGTVGLGWQAGRLHALDLRSGRVMWRRSGVLAPAALSQDAAWLVDESGVLIEVDAATGAVQGEHALPGGGWSVSLSPGGRLYVIGRPLAVRVFDLVGPVRTAAERTYPQVLMRHVPGVVALGRDGLLLAVTGDALLELRPERDDAVREVWRTDHTIVDATAADGQLAIVTLDARGGRFLTLFAEPDGSSGPGEP